MSDSTVVRHVSNSHVTYKVDEMANTGAELYGAFFIDNPDSMQIDLEARTVMTWDGQLHDITGVDFLSFGNRGNDIEGRTVALPRSRNGPPRKGIPRALT